MDLATGDRQGEQCHGLLYRSRMKVPLAPPDLVDLAAFATQHNAQAGITSALLVQPGEFLQWLEGPKSGVMDLLRRIAADPRHIGLEVMREGPVAQRHFGGHPLLMLSPVGGGLLSGPMVNGLGQTHPEMGRDAMRRLAFLAGQSGRTARVGQRSLAARVTEAEDMLAVLADGWKNDVWSSAEITLTLARLQGNWLREGRVPDPRFARHAVGIVVPDGASEIFGSIVKADVMRAAGVSVTLFDGEGDVVQAVSARPDILDAFVVAGPRVGHAGGSKAASGLAAALRQRFEFLPVHLGGAAGGCILDLPRRLGLARLESSPHNGPLEQLADLALALMALNRRGN
jgi:hypothetical protein